MSIILKEQQQKFLDTNMITDETVKSWLILKEFSHDYNVDCPVYKKTEELFGHDYISAGDGPILFDKMCPMCVIINLEVDPTPQSIIDEWVEVFEKQNAEE